jgi:hypothetical protein
VEHRVDFTVSLQCAREDELRSFVERLQEAIEDVHLGIHPIRTPVTLLIGENKWRGIP